MNETQYIVALEISSSKIVGAIAERLSSSNILVKHIEEVKKQDCVRYGCVTNVETTKTVVQSIIRNLEAQVPNGTIKEVYVGFGGRSVHAETVNVERHLNSDTAITERIIDDMLHEARNKKCTPGFSVLDVAPGKYRVDKVEVLQPRGMFGSNVATQMHQVVARPALLTNLNRVLGDLGFTVKGYTVTHLGLGQHAVKSDERSLGCMLVDMGAETTTVSIYRDGILKYLNTLPLGGRNITRDIMALNVLEEKAESVKKSIMNPLNHSAENVTIEGMSSSSARNYIIARTGEILANINMQLTYANFKPEDLHNIVLVGGASLLPGLADKLSELTKLPVRMATIPANVKLNPGCQNKVEYIEMFSLLLESAADMGAADNCIEVENFSGELPFTSDEETKPQPEPQEEEEEEDTKKTAPSKSFFEKMKGILVGLTDDSKNESI